MHPIERLRYVARAGRADQASLVHETAGSLAAMGLDPAEAVTACRRVVQRHPFAGALWTLCNRTLTAVDPRTATVAYLDEIDADPTAGHVETTVADDATVVVVGWPEVAAGGLARRGDVRVLVIDTDGDGSQLVRRLLRLEIDAEEVPAAGIAAAVVEADVVVLDAHAAGPTGVVAAVGSHAAAAVAHHLGRPVLVCVGAGRALAPSVYDTVRARMGLDADPWHAPVEEVPAGLVAAVVGPTGRSGADALAARADAPVAPELLRALHW